MCAKYRWHELGDAWSVFLFVHHIVTSDQIWEALFTTLDVVENLRYVRLTNHLVAGEDEGHLEVGHALLHLVDDALDHFKFFKQIDDIVLSVHLGASGILRKLEKTASCVAQLNDENVLLDAGVNRSTKQALKEGPVLCQAADSGEFVLEVSPDVVRLEADCLVACQQDLLPENIIVLLRVFVPGAHLLALDEPVFLGGRICENFEQTRSFVVVARRVISQLNVDIYVRRCCRVHVVKTTFGHLSENLVELRCFNFLFDFVKVLNCHVVEWSNKPVLQLLQLLVSCSLFVGSLAFLVVREVLLCF